MVWLYIVLGISVALNIGLGIALYVAQNNYKKAADLNRKYRILGK